MIHIISCNHLWHGSWIILSCTLLLYAYHCAWIFNNKLDQN